MNTDIQVFAWICVFISLGYEPQSGNAGSYGNFIFNFLRSCQTVYQRCLPDCSILKSYL